MDHYIDIKLNPDAEMRENLLKNSKAEMYRKGIDNPYLELESASNGLLHRRYISFSGLKQKAVSGKFDSFGLSKTATVPWF